MRLARKKKKKDNLSYISEVIWCKSSLQDRITGKLLWNKEISINQEQVHSMKADSCRHCCRSWCFVSTELISPTVLQFQSNQMKTTSNIKKKKKKPLRLQQQSHLLTTKSNTLLSDGWGVWQLESWQTFNWYCELIPGQCWAQDMTTEHAFVVWCNQKCHFE